MLEMTMLIAFIAMCTAITARELYILFHTLRKNKKHDKLLREDIKAMMNGDYERCKDITEIVDKHFHNKEVK